MYTITYVHMGAAKENTLYIPGDDTYCLVSGKLSLACGASGELVLEIPDENPAKAEIEALTDEVIVYRDGVEIWRGRPVTMEVSFDLTGKLTCEGVLSYLYDTFYPPYDFSGSPSTFIDAVLANHNSQVEERKRIYLGTVTVEDNNDYIARSSTSYDRSLDVLTGKLVNESLGGYLRVRVEDGVKYLDYLESYGTTASQKVELGVNLLDLADEIEYGDVITALLPLGATDDDTGETLTIESVNNGEKYIYDEEAVAKYGWIEGQNTWEDVTLASNLLTKAEAYLAQRVTGIQSFTVKVVDLSLATDDEAAFDLGDLVLVQSEPHGANLWVELSEYEINILEPQNGTLLGHKMA